MLLKQLLSLTVSGAGLLIPSQLAILILGFFYPWGPVQAIANCWRKAFSSLSCCRNCEHWSRSLPPPAMTVSVGLVPLCHFTGTTEKMGQDCAVKHPDSLQAFPQRPFFFFFLIGGALICQPAAGLGVHVLAPKPPGALPHTGHGAAPGCLLRDGRRQRRRRLLFLRLALAFRCRSMLFWTSGGAEQKVTRWFSPCH